MVNHERHQNHEKEGLTSKHGGKKKPEPRSSHCHKIHKEEFDPQMAQISADLGNYQDDF